MHTKGLHYLCSEVIQPAWIDYNGHMNVAYYVLVFDAGTDALLDTLGINSAHREHTQTSTYVLETHINYERELLLDATVDIYLQLVDFDQKRIHYALFMQHRDEEFQAASCEIMLMHINMKTTRGSPMPDFALDKLAEIQNAQVGLPQPPNLGSVIGIRRKD